MVFAVNLVCGRKLPNLRIKTNILHYIFGHRKNRIEFSLHLNFVQIRKKNIIECNVKHIHSLHYI